MVLDEVLVFAIAVFFCKYTDNVLQLDLEGVAAKQLLWRKSVANRSHNKDSKFFSIVDFNYIIT